MKITLNIAERLQLVSFLNGFQGKSFETLNEVWKLIDLVKITEEEKSEIHLRQEGQSVVWDVGAPDKQVDVTLDESKAFMEEFEAKSEAKSLGADIYNLAQVYIKLKT